LTPSTPPAATPEAGAAAPAAPLISLVLPLNAPEFTPAAAAVQRGCAAALSIANPRPGAETVRTDASVGGVRDAWNAAAAHGAAVVVGPLTRDAVTALAASLLQSPPAPGAPHPRTLALNGVEAVGGSAPLPPAFYSFGLPLEAEARAVAGQAWSDNARSVVVVQSRSPLGMRTGAAFAAAWRARGGRVRVESFQAGADLEPLRQRLESERGRPDAVFLATDAAEARQARPYLGVTLPVYATSQVNDGRRGVGDLDLGGVHFVDMPWLLQPDHPAVMVYPRPAEAMNADLQRLYALGIDACRLAALMAVPTPPDRLTLDGVTGVLSLRLDDARRDAGQSVEREPLSASFVSGAGIAVDGAGGTEPQQAH
jgi:outer membrane PBP1 activator LpoA protein